VRGDAKSCGAEMEQFEFAMKNGLLEKMIATLICLKIVLLREVLPR
jgi:hypothetical protein